MSFHFEGVGPDPAVGPFRSQDFPTQADAESWLTASYVDLVDDGIESITLYSDDTLVYGPMSLLP